MENKKNLVDFLKSKGELTSHEICVDGNDGNADYYRDNFDLESFEPLKIINVTEKEGQPIIDVMDRTGKLYKGFGTRSFQPYNRSLNKDFQNYLKSND